MQPASPIATVVAATGVRPTAEPPPRTVRVATFNIRHGVGLDRVLDLERTAAVVRSTGAEVVGLQEVDRHFGPRSAHVDQAGWLADRLGMHAVFGAAVDRDPPAPGSPRRQYGTAVLSRRRIVEWAHTLLPRRGRSEQRGLLQAVVEVRGRRVRVCVTHLQHTSRAERLAQIAAVRAALDRAGEPVVLLGDLNATPDAPEIDRLTETLVDVWAATGVGRGYTFDAATPHARIDYVMASPTLAPRGAGVIDTDASDHRPVVADLVVPTDGVDG